MCGIAGLLNHSPSASAETLTAHANAMAATLAHRGPDGSGVWCDAGAGIALGHRRLAVLDLSPAGHQPMASASGRYMVVLNGEIYNFPELRRELEGRTEFRGHSDTEVLTSALDHWGLAAALPRLVGMFALAVWDRSLRRLSLARDRLGEKPLYYARTCQGLLFGSELKALRAYPGWTPSLQRSALLEYLRYGWINAPATIYTDCCKLSPGHLLHWQAGDAWPPPQTPYWQLSDSVRAEPLPLAAAEAVDEFGRRLQASVAGQMLADVPVGAFLSGGIDSSLIVAQMQRQSRRPVRTFSMGFNDPRFDEAPHARAVARHLGTDHTELYVSPEQARELIPQLPAIYDEPFGDSSQIPTLLLAQLTRRSVTVSLSGDGGDELAGGYKHYFSAARAAAGLDWLPAPLRHATGQLLQHGSPLGWDLPRGAIIAKLGRFLAADSASARHAALHTQIQSAEQLLRDVAPPPPWPTMPVSRQAATLTEKLMYLDSISYLPGDILVKLDRATMAVSLEARAPFLDHRLFEFVTRLPAALKVREGTGKWLLRQLLARDVPETITARPKMGFSVPMGDWLRGPLRSWADDLLSPARLRAQGYFRPDTVARLWRDHCTGRRNLAYTLWTILMFQAWSAEAERASAVAVQTIDTESIQA